MKEEKEERRGEERRDSCPASKKSGCFFVFRLARLLLPRAPFLAFFWPFFVVDRGNRRSFFSSLRIFPACRKIA